jgi:hypothetical protein
MKVAFFQYLPVTKTRVLVQLSQATDFIHHTTAYFQTSNLLNGVDSFLIISHTIS